MKILIVSLVFLFSPTLWAQSPQGSDFVEVQEATSNANVLDFEAEVIEGQRKAPQLFMQMELGTPDLDSVMYLRQNFNDFHNVEAKRKPSYRKAIR